MFSLVTYMWSWLWRHDHSWNSKKKKNGDDQFYGLKFILVPLLLLLWIIIIYDNHVFDYLYHHHHWWFFVIWYCIWHNNKMDPKWHNILLCSLMANHFLTITKKLLFYFSLIHYHSNRRNSFIIQKKTIRFVLIFCFSLKKMTLNWNLNQKKKKQR